ncbi:uncharacterized protein LOC111282799 [Durio zibethinus]|uniref:Uncharacterized protein LOC111282799 n=1 Tax=Durio zibethinus TaxID=66656 RepID=A0A6P5XEU6_DURZI|nr:uncharacterized protein LOC111282799 [Durio zibethinus]
MRIICLCIWILLTHNKYGWSRYAQFSLAVVNQIHNKYSIRKRIAIHDDLVCHVQTEEGASFCSNLRRYTMLGFLLHPYFRLSHGQLLCKHCYNDPQMDPTM